LGSVDGKGREEIRGVEKCFSFYGRTISVDLNSNLFPLFRILVGVAKRIEKIMRNLLWEGFGDGKKAHLISWDIVCRPRDKGGLGIGSVVLKNLALLKKWIRRVPLETNSIWHTVIRSMVCKEMDEILI